MSVGRWGRLGIRKLFIQEFMDTMTKRYKNGEGCFSSRCFEGTGDLNQRAQKIV